jgi:hypothetical protein
VTIIELQCPNARLKQKDLSGHEQYLAHTTPAPTDAMNSSLSRRSKAHVLEKQGYNCVMELWHDHCFRCRAYSIE